MSRKAEFFYFDGRGRGELIRLVLTAAGIEYTEKHITTREEFLALYPDLMFHQLPLLKIDGLNLIQSSATARYIARKGNLFGTKEPDISRIDMVYEGSRDYLNAVFMPVGFEHDENKMDVHKPIVTKYLTLFSKILEENGTGYFVGSHLTLADLGVLETILATIDYYGKDALNDFPAVEKFFNVVTSLERISKYIKEIRKPRNNPEIIAVVKRVLNR
jgi:glutathione S-transferase